MQSLLGKSTGVDDEQVEEWLHEDARNQEYYEKAKYYFDNYYSGEKEIHQINMKKAWDDFLVYTKKSRNNIWKRYLQYVAGVVMLLGVGVALLLLNLMRYGIMHCVLSLIWCVKVVMCTWQMNLMHRQK